MALFGWNSFPFEFGGGKSLEQKAYESLKSAVGIGGSDPEEDSIDALIREAHARGLAVAASFDESAALQMFPHLATDHIPVFEDVLGIVSNEEEDEQTRRLRVVREWIRIVSGVVSDIEAELQTIDSRFSVVSIGWAAEATTEIGKPFERLDGTDAFNSASGAKSTLVPNYSSVFVLRVLFDLGSGAAPNAAEMISIEEAKRVLNRALPSWMTFSLGTELGFILDTSLLDGGMLDDS